MSESRLATKPRSSSSNASIEREQRLWRTVRGFEAESTSWRWAVFDTVSSLIRATASASYATETTCEDIPGL